MTDSSPRLTLPILGGPLAGFRWSPTSGGKIARVFLGTYEAEQSESMARSIPRAGTFFDVGAHHGYYTLLASRRVGAGGKVVCFEPSPDNLPFLKKHIAKNQLDQVTLIESAVGSAPGRLRFAKGSGTGTGHLSDEGDIEVPVTTVDNEVERLGCAPDTMKIDVEGAEMHVLRGASQTLKQHRPTIFLSTHGADVHRQCCEFLSTIGYDLSPILGDDLATTTEVFAVSHEAVSAAAA